MSGCTVLKSRPCSCGAAALQLSIQYSVLSLLFSLRVVANGGPGTDHLGAEGDPHHRCSQLCHYSYCHGSASGVGTEDWSRLLSGARSKCPKLKHASTVRVVTVTLNHDVSITLLKEDSEREQSDSFDSCPTWNHWGGVHDLSSSPTNRGRCRHLCQLSVSITLTHLSL